MLQNGQNPRVQAVRWWTNLPIDERKRVVENWKAANPKYAEWDYSLISKSSNLVESVFLFTCGSK